jgi:pimeloyl-ACP methyl ester carboxylesterase
VRTRAGIRKILLGLAAGALGVGALVLVEFVFLRGRTPPIETPRGIASLEKLRLGGVEQSVLIRGHDRSRPVLLFLHGGPGMPAMYLAHAFQRELERDFVVVHWDRRGAGRSFEAVGDSAPLSVSQTLADTHELTRHLRTRFGQDRIYLVGHSWGSYLGLLAVRDRPEHCAAFVGMGQLAGTRAEVDALRRDCARRLASGTEDSVAARADGPRRVTEDELFRCGAELHEAQSFWPILRTGLAAPEYTIFDALNVKRGADRVGREMRYDVEPRPLEGEVEKVDVPVFFFLGRHDLNTPSRLAAEYLDRLEAPLKYVVWFEESAHFPFFEQPVRFHEEMRRVAGTVSEFWRTTDPEGA